MTSTSKTIDKEVTGHDGRSHALCSASSAHRWLKCPASVYMCDLYPEEEASIYAIAGTKAHEMAERQLRLWLDPTKKEEKLESDEMGKAVNKFVKFVKEQAEINFPISKPTIKLEQRIVLNRELNLWGTTDVLMTGYDADYEALGVIMDFKYGKSKVVAEGNPQLGYYAAALMNTSNMPLKRIKVFIHQPRLKQPVTSVTYTRKDLYDWTGVLTTGAETAMHQYLGLHEKTYVLGDWCKYCTGKNKCPERSKEPAEGAGLEFLEE